MSSPHAPTSFHLFNSLPAELRFQIYRLGSQPRVVSIAYDGLTDRCQTTTKPPAIMQVSREAREEASHWYHRAFSTYSRPGEYVYFNPVLDVLYFPRPDSLLGYDDAARDFSQRVRDTPLVRSLAIDHVRPDVIRPWEPYNKLCLLQGFVNLTHTYLVFAEQDDSGSGARRGSEIELIDPRGDVSDVMRLIDGVIESFVHEVGPTVCGLGVERGVEDQMYTMPFLEPKAKVSRGWRESSNVVQCV